MKSQTIKAVVSGLFAACLFVVAVYAGWLQWRMGKSVSAIECAPVTRWIVDFSTTNSYRLPFKHTCRPAYGTVYLMLKPTPIPADWKQTGDSDDMMGKMEAVMTLCTTNDVEIHESNMLWLYNFQHDVFPCEQFFNRMPEGEYVLKIRVNAGVSALAGVKQELSLHYDYLYEKHICLYARVVCLMAAILGMLAARLSWASAKKIRRATLS